MSSTGSISSLQNADGARAADDNPSDVSLDIAIIGGGIIGLMTALGLLRRGMRVTIYERANRPNEISAGFAFTSVARECMKRIDMQILEALQRIGHRSSCPQNRYWDGFNSDSKAAEQSEELLLFSMPASELDYFTCLRAHFLWEMLDLLPKGVIKFGKQLKDYEDDSHINNRNDRKIVLSFNDGSVALADAVIGCDGIRSRTRQLLLGKDNPASYATYTHKVAYRAVVPIVNGISALGYDKANGTCFHMGPNTHVVTYPVDNYTLLNFVVFVYDPEPWADPDKMTVPATRDEVQHALVDWRPSIRKLADLLPEHLTKWGVFDMADHPPSTYARGRICLTGDAAHASSPFHGLGACMGVEDALVLVTSLETANSKIRGGLLAGLEKTNAISSALQAFSVARLERTLTMTQMLRDTGDIYQWRFTSTGRDAAKCKAAFEYLERIARDFDVDGATADTKMGVDV